MQAILGIAGLIVAIIGILDVVKSSMTGGNKALWIILILVLPVIGFVIYWFVGRKKAA